MKINNLFQVFFFFFQRSRLSWVFQNTQTLRMCFDIFSLTGCGFPDHRWAIWKMQNLMSKSS